MICGFICGTTLLLWQKSQSLKNSQLLVCWICQVTFSNFYQLVLQTYNGLRGKLPCKLSLRSKLAKHDSWLIVTSGCTLTNPVSSADSKQEVINISTKLLVFRELAKMDWYKLENELLNIFRSGLFRHQWKLKLLFLLEYWASWLLLFN